MAVKEIIDGIIAREGNYVNDANDLGGATKYGITEKVARANGYTGDMKDLPRDFAYAVYLKDYWTAPGFDQVAKLSPAVAEEMCDTGVNCGVATAKPMLQRALNLLNQQGKDFSDVDVDGAIGPGTLHALALYLAKRGGLGEQVLVKVLNILQGARYIDITEKREPNEEFFFGWISNRI